jgi:hypothetical protein
MSTRAFEHGESSGIAAESFRESASRVLEFEGGRGSFRGVFELLARERRGVRGASVQHDARFVDARAAHRVRFDVQQFTAVETAGITRE